MSGIHDLPLFLLSALLLNLTPGQDTMVILARSASGGLREGVGAALGINLGCLVHLALAVSGAAALLASSPALFAAVKTAGALYLGWLGLSLWREAFRRWRGAATAETAATAATAITATTATTAAVTVESAQRGSRGFRAALLQGFLTNLLNPKVALFFLAFLPQFLSPQAADPAWSITLLGLFFVASSSLWCLVVAGGAARASQVLQSRARAGGKAAISLNAAGGALMLWLAVRLAG